VIGTFAPQFCGYDQHDSHELLTFLLDGLHEDVNRVRSKPTTETIEAANMDPVIASEEAWRQHRARNDSHLVDLFHGQYRSTVRCDNPDCGKVSVTFDPFMCLSLPIGQYSKSRQLDVYFHPADKWLTLAVPKLGTIRDLKGAVAKMTGLAAADLLIAGFHASCAERVYKDTDEIVDLPAKQMITAFEFCLDSQQNCNIFFLHHYITRSVKTQDYWGVCSVKQVSAFEGVPLPILVPAVTSGPKLNEQVQKTLVAAGLRGEFELRNHFKDTKKEEVWDHFKRMYVKKNVSFWEEVDIPNKDDGLQY
jgi:ubiquitin carboxyl-terminal hydrolase 4/11/15